MLCAGYRSAESIVKGWMESDVHRPDLLDKNWTYAVAAYNGTKWVVLFGC